MLRSAASSYSGLWACLTIADSACPKVMGAPALSRPVELPAVPVITSAGFEVSRRFIKEIRMALENPLNPDRMADAAAPSTAAPSPAGAGSGAAIGDVLPAAPDLNYGDPEIVERRRDPLHSNGGKEQLDEDELVDVLNDLLECCCDGEHGYKECAQHTRTPDLKTLLFSHARHCASGAAELKEQIRQIGGKPDAGGSVGEALHRGWVSVRGALAGRSDQAMLGECERGEDAALACYRRALRQPLPASVRSMVEIQRDRVQHNHDQIKALRDSLRAEKE
ncbi:MAG: PA2169 family four-helix-bundle protein [Polaromonas sp.]|nr:PA2169 family four-helix-bundle protein [Polaromonas sp.]